MKRIAMMCLMAAIWVGTLCSCSANREEAVSRTGFALDTVVSVTVYDAGEADADRALDAAFHEMTRLEKLLSVTDADSDVSRINAAGGQPVTVAAETADVITLALWYAQLTDGAMDITIHPVSALWDFKSSDPTVPDKQMLQEAARLVDYRNVIVEGQTITLRGGSIDLGGIAKGYVADRVRQVLSDAGVVSALVDLGGNIVALGDKGGQPFRVGVKDPSSPDQLAAILSGTDNAMVTSGIYERGFTVNGVRYHHLLDPTTGMPVQNTLASVTIVCARSADADALSTACFVMGEERAAELIDTLEGVEALFIRRDGTLRATDGLFYTVS